jgi:hypothetical protein
MLNAEGVLLEGLRPLGMGPGGTPGVICRFPRRVGGCFGAGDLEAGNLIAITPCVEVMKNVISCPCGAGKLRLQICAGKANPDFGSWRFCVGCGWAVAGIWLEIINLV